MLLSKPLCSCESIQKTSQPYQRLPPEVWIEIGRFLPARDLVALLQMNQEMKTLAAVAFNTNVNDAQARIAEYQNASNTSIPGIYYTLKHFVKLNDVYALMALSHNTQLCNFIASEKGFNMVAVVASIPGIGSSFIAAHYKSMQNSRGVMLIHLAAELGLTFLLKRLVCSYGIPVDSEDASGHTPLSHAIAYNQHRTIDILICYLGVNVNAISCHNTLETPLHEAVGQKKTAIVTYLISKGANPDATDRYGYTPKDIAAKKGFVNLMLYLVPKP